MPWTRHTWDPLFSTGTFGGRQLPKDKVGVSLQLESDHLQWLKDIVERFEFPDESKAMRVLLDYAIQDIEDEVIFAFENMRCTHCNL